MRISDWSSDVCSSDLVAGAEVEHALAVEVVAARRQHLVEQLRKETRRIALEAFVEDLFVQPGDAVDAVVVVEADVLAAAVLVVEEEIDVALRLAAEIDVRQPDAVSHVLDHSMFLFLLGVCLRSYCRATRRSPRGVDRKSTRLNSSH